MLEITSGSIISRMASALVGITGKVINTLMSELLSWVGYQVFPQHTIEVPCKAPCCGEKIDEIFYKRFACKCNAFFSLYIMFVWRFNYLITRNKFELTNLSHVNFAVACYNILTFMKPVFLCSAPRYLSTRYFRMADN